MEAIFLPPLPPYCEKDNDGWYGWGSALPFSDPAFPFPPLCQRCFLVLPQKGGGRIVTGAGDSAGEYWPVLRR